METLFQSNFITINYSQQLNALVSTWHNTANTEDYIAGIKAFKNEFDKLIDVNTLWNNVDFKYNIPDELKLWTDRFINASAVEQGFNKKMALIIGHDLPPALSVIDIIQNSEVVFQNRFFSNENQAIEWISKKQESIQVSANEPKWKVDLLNNQKALISLEIDSSDLAIYLKQINQLIKDRRFIIEQRNRFQRLTARERHILSLILKGNSNEEIAELLFLSCYTVKTHRNRINQKLQCKAMTDMLLYRLFL